MNLEFQYGATNISFDVIFKKRKTLEIAVMLPDIVKVTAPIGISNDRRIEIVKGKGSWIVKKLYSIKHINYKHLNKEYVNGESFMYLGRNYSLEIITDKSVKKPQVKLYRGKFTVTAKDKDENAIKNAMELWYREKAKEVIKERIKYYERFFDTKPRSIKIKEQKKRWGSCTYRNDLLFNWRCVMAKSTSLDYIIVHEMCHMVHKNHSKDFWTLVESILPDYKERKEWLKKYGIFMNL